MYPSVFPRKAIQPCLPKPAKEPPAGPGWIHEIKHDGFRILARRDGDSVRLYTRNGYNFADRFPRRLPRTRRREAKVVGKARPSLRSHGVRSSGDQTDNRLP